MNEHVELTLPDISGWELPAGYRPFLSGREKLAEMEKAYGKSGVFSSGECSDELRSLVMAAVKEAVKGKFGVEKQVLPPVKEVVKGSRYSAARKVAVVRGFVYDGAVSPDGFVRGRSVVLYRPEQEVVPAVSEESYKDWRKSLEYRVWLGLRWLFGESPLAHPAPSREAGRAEGKKASVQERRFEAVFGGMAVELVREKLSYEQFIRLYHADRCEMAYQHGHLSEEDFRSLGVVLEEEEEQVGFWEEWESEDGEWFEEEVFDGAQSFHLSHWMGEVVGEFFPSGSAPESLPLMADVVSEKKPAFTAQVDGVVMAVGAPRKQLLLPSALFYTRTRIEGRRSGFLSLAQAAALKFSDVPSAVQNAPSGVHPLAPLMGVKRVSKGQVQALEAQGFRVEKRMVEGKKSEVVCLVVP